jgi:hypothetical protein
MFNLSRIFTITYGQIKNHQPSCGWFLERLKGLIQETGGRSEPSTAIESKTFVSAKAASQGTQASLPPLIATEGPYLAATEPEWGA